MTFYVIAGLMILLALAFVLVPLWRPPARPSVSVDEGNVEALRVQRREVEADHARGLLNDADREGVLAELTVRLAEQISTASEPAPQSTSAAGSGAKSARILGVLLSVLLVGGTVVGYTMWGAHEARSPAAPAQSANVEPDQPMSDKQVLALVENLARKMEANPEDPKGWILLARSQNALGQWAAAAAAYDRAVALTSGDPLLLATLLADYADVQVMAQEGNFAGKPMALIQRALKLDPSNMKALALAGSAEMRAGNKAQSIKHWEKLKSLVPADSADYAQVVAIINEIKTGKPAFPQPSPASSQPAAIEARSAATGKTVSGQVTIARELLSKVGKGDTLFILARATDGPRMPLAVVRIPLPTTWPYRFELSDDMAMAPGMNLSAFPKVTIEARVSRAGNAALQAGDLQGMSGAVTAPTGDINITIDKVAP